MMLKRNLFSHFALIGFSIVATPSAFACSYVINQMAVGNALGASALTHLKLSLNDVKSVSVTEFKYWESMPTPMCPDEVTYEAKIRVSWYDPTTIVPTTCNAALKVTKIEPWGERRAKVSDKYKYEVISAANCQPG